MFVRKLLPSSSVLLMRLPFARPAMTRSLSLSGILLLFLFGWVNLVTFYLCLWKGTLSVIRYWGVLICCDEG